MKTIINESLNVKKEELNIPIMYYKFNPNRTQQIAHPNFYPELKLVDSYQLEFIPIQSA